jgi:hypothetical protein
MGAMKHELMRLADIVIYGTPETIEREFRAVSGLSDGGAVQLLAYAIEMARTTSPLCDCGADYHAELFAKWPQFVEQTNKAPARIERILSNAGDGWK